jgi:hypothetical protein
VIERLCVAGAALAWGSIAAADVMTFNPSRDNTLYENPTGDLSNGVGQGMFSGKTDSGLIRRALVAFDLSALPAGAVVTDVSLRLVCTKTTAPAELTTLHRVGASWGEANSDGGFSGGAGGTAAPGDATWIWRFYDDPSSAWATPGGDFAPAVSGSATVAGTGAYTFSGAGMLADVQAWINEPATNFGWLVRGNESTNHTAKRFGTREYPSASGRPLLTVTYTIPAPQSAGVLALGLLAATRRRRR